MYPRKLLQFLPRTDLTGIISTARRTMVKELDARFFDSAECPSNIRLVQCWMSKQRPAEKWLPEGWRVLAKGLYLGMLREAAKIAGIGLSSSPCNEGTEDVGGQQLSLAQSVGRRRRRRRLTCTDNGRLGLGRSDKGGGALGSS